MVSWAKGGEKKKKKDNRYSVQVLKKGIFSWGSVFGKGGGLGDVREDSLRLRVIGLRRETKARSGNQTISEDQFPHIRGKGRNRSNTRNTSRT